jgi:elongation factor G
MREYRSGDIRNIAVVGHGASGKTTLVDALAFVSGASKRHGSVRDGTALTDFAPEEVDRGFSISLGCAHAEWMGTKIKLLDTPGYLDFQSDAVAGIAAADGALLVVSGASGVEVGTERMFHEAIRRRDPVLVVVSMMDKEHASFESVWEEIKKRLDSRVIPVEVPIGEGANFHGILNLFDKKAHLFKKGTKTGEYTEVDVPDEHRALFDQYYEQLIETIAATDDTLLERYLDGGEISRADALNAMKEAMKRGELFPLFCCSSELTYGTQALLSKIVELMPSAYEMEELHAFVGAEGDRTVEIHANDDAPFTALVFKTASEPHVGDVLYFRTFAGTLHNGQDVYNATRDGTEKMSHLGVAQGRERLEVPLLHPGDIGCVAKLKNTHTNDTLSTREHPVRLPRIEFPHPRVSFAVHATARAEEEKLQQALHRMHDEDPSFETHYNPETHETIVSGLGERHLEVSLAKLKRKYGVSAELTRPKIAYRETIMAKSEGQGRHKKQSGGRGQFGDCWIRMSPAPRGRGYNFVNSIVGGAIPSKYIPAVDKGIQEASIRGVLAGYPMVDFEVEVYDGSYHSVDSSEQSFKMAGIQAYNTVASKCKPVLLEPLDEIEITTPDEYMGDVLGAISARRGHILGTEASQGNGTVIRAVVPQAELHGFATEVQSMTHGYGGFSQKFHGYEQMPSEATHSVIEEAKANGAHTKVHAHA